MNDLISRQAVLDYIDSMPSELTADGRRMIRRIRLIEYIRDSIPPVQPGQKIGRWVKYKSWYACSECRSEMFFTGTYDESQRYCYNCGARMEE